MTGLRVRREVLRLATAVMEAAWFYVAWRLLFALFAPQAPVIGFGLVLGGMVIAVYVARYLDLGRAGTRRQGWAVAVSALVVTLASAWLAGFGGPASFLTGLRDFEDGKVIYLVGSLVLWWRAVSLVADGFSVERIGLRFRIGVVIFFWSLIGVGLVGLQGLTPYVFIYFTAGLLSMALARVEEVSRDLSGAATPFDATWASTLGVAVLTVMLVGLVAVVVLTPDAIRTILGWLAPLWGLLGVIFIGIVYVLVWLLNPLLEAFMRALRPTLERLPQLPQATATPTPDDAATAARQLLPEAVVMGLRWVGLLAGLALAFWLLSLWAQRRRQALLDPVPELRESVWSRDAFAEDARNLLDRALGRFRGRRHTQSTENVRRIYASLQALAAEHGVPRPPDDTPYEYLPALLAAFPGAEADLRFLTTAYVDAHYHELPTSDVDLRRARSAWEQARRVITDTPKPRQEVVGEA